jgi:hypothetical protein
MSFSASSMWCQLSRSTRRRRMPLPCSRPASPSTLIHVTVIAPFHWMWPTTHRTVVVGVSTDGGGCGPPASMLPGPELGRAARPPAHEGRERIPPQLLRVLRPKEAPRLERRETLAQRVELPGRVCWPNTSSAQEMRAERLSGKEARAEPRPERRRRHLRWARAHAPLDAAPAAHA